MTATVAFLGTGSMNGSILSGLAANGFDAENLRATVRSEESASKLPEKIGLQGLKVLSSESDPEANQKAASEADVILLGVKPYDILELAEEIADSLSSDALVISVAAGISLEALQKALPEGQPAIRCMPNTPSRVGKGVLAISASESCNDKHLELAHEVLSAVGTVIEVEEDQMDAVTAVSGSGPAYAFLLAETMAQAGIKLGLDDETATKLAAATVAGAGYLLDADPQPESLRKAVTSPGGTTEQAILAYQEGGLAELTEKAMNACATKSQEMTKEYSK